MVVENTYVFIIAIALLFVKFIFSNCCNNINTYKNIFGSAKTTDGFSAAIAL